MLLETQSFQERRRTIFQTNDLVPAIRGWLESTRPQGVPTGPSMNEMSRRAIHLIERLRTEPLDSTVSEMKYDLDAPDLLHAVIEVLGENRDDPSKANLDSLGRAYELVLRLTWPDDFGERDELLARSAFLAWNQARLLVDYPASRVWKARCTEHTLAQEHLRNFISLGFAERSPELNDRFLSDEAVLLTLCDQLERERNRSPVDASREGRELYQWLDKHIATVFPVPELSHFLAASVALSVLGAEHHQANRNEQVRWSERARSHVGQCLGSEVLELVLEHLRLATLYVHDGSSRQLAESCGRLIARMESVRMADAIVRTRQLHGVVLKEIGENEQALDCFVKARAGARECGDSVVASLAVGTCAQIFGAQDRLDEAMTAAKESIQLARQSGCVLAIAYAQGTVAELLRDHGSLSASVEVYAACVDSYEEQGLKAWAAYTRVLRAEALLMVGRPAEAVAEVVAALPVLEQNNLTREAIAAIAILREAVHRQQADPEALRQLREQLDLMRQERKL